MKQPLIFLSFVLALMISACDGDSDDEDASTTLLTLTSENAPQVTGAV